MEKSKLNYFKWFTSDIDLLKEQLNAEQIGELFISVMEYVQDGIVKNVSDAIKWPYGDYRRRVDASRTKYDTKCATNAANGRKGGKAKASRARQADTLSDASVTINSHFKPPTRTIFKNAAARFRDDGCLDADQYDVDCFFESLESASWCINGEPIISRCDWESALKAKFPDVDTRADLTYWGLWSAFSNIFQIFHGLRDKDGETNSYWAAYEFCKIYDNKQKGWRINDVLYQKTEEAITAFITISDEYSKYIVANSSD